MIILAIIEKIDWTPTIGDPTFIGWFTVIAYLVASFLCFTCARKNSRLLSSRSGNSIRNFWFSLALILLLLAINKQLDLQTLFTVVGRQTAIDQGWYEQRRTVQLQFVVGLVAIMTGLLSLTAHFLGKQLKQISFALIGLFFLSTFVIVRAISFHYIDRFINLDLAGFSMNWILELGGILCIIFSALHYRSKLNQTQAVRIGKNHHLR